MVLPWVAYPTRVLLSAPSIVPNKVEKGTQGIDCRIVDPKNKAHRIFVITLGRAGEDYATFQLRDVDSTFQGFVGADYELQDAMTDAVNIERGEREEGGRRYFDYRVEASGAGTAVAGRRGAIAVVMSLRVERGELRARRLRTCSTTPPSPRRGAACTRCSCARPSATSRRTPACPSASRSRSARSDVRMSACGICTRA